MEADPVKLTAALLAALALSGAATSALACSGAWKQTTAQNEQRTTLPPADARS
jgi:hypothetical protein